MALYHFILPYQFLWQQKMVQSPPIFSWALMVINFDWSLLSCVIALILLSSLRTPEKETQSKRSLTLGFVFCWLVHTGYLIVDPVVLPERLDWLNSLFVAFAALTCLMLACGLWVFSPAAVAKKSEAISLARQEA